MINNWHETSLKRLRKQEKDGVGKMWEEYWSKFTKQISHEKSRGDGYLFETLVKYLLQAKFGVKWTRTNKSHDDNRDFWLYLEAEQQRIWAECKNYSKTIAMDVLAPTLVMAQVYDTNTILFFSRSSINRFAKNKILAFGAKVEKQIYFYDNEILQNLIWECRDSLPKKFRPPKSCAPTAPQQFPAELFFFQGAIRGVCENDECYQSLSSVTSVRYNETFGLFFSVSNPFPDKWLHIKISFSDEDSDRLSFQYLNVGVSETKSLWHERDLEGGEGCAIALNMRPIRFMPTLCLPGFQIEGSTEDGETYRHTFKPLEVSCRWVGQTKLIGHQYEKIIRETEEQLVRNNELSMLVLSGHSGTGKTRMLNECANIFLKYGYSILSLVGTEDYSSCYFLKEIISFLYEIPSAEIIELLERKSASGTGTQSEEMQSKYQAALSLFCQIDQLRNEEDVRQFVDEHGQLLFEKIADHRCTLMVDNVQFAGEGFQYFLHQYTAYSANMNRTNQSVLLYVFNLDYMTDSASKLIFELLHSNVKHLVSRKIAGFETAEVGVLFLRELIRVEDERFDSLFRTIIERVSPNPYHLFQMVQHFEENGAVCVTPQEQGYILEDASAWELVSNISGGIKEVLGKRWAFLSHKLSESRLLQICSVLFLFDKINPDLAKCFALQLADLETLVQFHFLRKSSQDVYVFDHDIIRNFFVTGRREKLLACLEWLRINSEPANLLKNPQVYDLYQISVVRDNAHTYSVLTQLQNHQPSARLSSFFYHELFGRCLDMGTEFQNKTDWIQCLNDICKRIRSTDGSVVALECYERGHAEIRRQVGKDAYTRYTPAYRMFLHFYVDILVELHYKDKAEELIDVVLQESGDLTGIDEQCSDELRVLNAIMYNRWYVAYNADFPSLSVKTKREDLMKRSMAQIPKLKTPKLRNLIAYLNYSDEGYNYYGYKRDEAHLLKIWDKCMVGMPKAAPEKTLNYYRKRLQYDLIHQDFDATIADLKTGREYLENGEFSHEPLIFDTFFLMAEIMAYLQTSPQQSAAYIERLLTQLSQIQQLLENGKMGDILLLRGVNAFYSRDMDDAYYAFHGAYIYYNKGQTSRHWIKKELLLENIHMAFTELDIYSADYDLRFLPEQYQTPLTAEAYASFRVSGIQQTKDGHMNLPLI